MNEQPNIEHASDAGRCAAAAPPSHTRIMTPAVRRSDQPQTAREQRDEHREAVEARQENGQLAIPQFCPLG